MNIGIIGCGAIGSTLAKAAEEFEEISEIYVFDKSHVCSRIMEEKFHKVKSVLDFDDLISKADFVIEAASQEAVYLFAEDILKSGKNILIMSVGALADDTLRNKLEIASKENKCKVFIPTGALCGIDGLNSASVLGIDEVTLITRKPPSAFLGVEYLKEKGIDLDKITSPTIIFEGTAREAVSLFPQNINVAATVSLSGIGFEKTKVKIIADPTTSENHHKIVARGTFGSMNAEMNNRPFDKNPKTSKIAAQSAISALKKMVDEFWVGV